jgi:hypothetical protein
MSAGTAGAWHLYQPSWRVEMVGGGAKRAGGSQSCEWVGGAWQPDRPFWWAEMVGGGAKRRVRGGAGEVGVVPYWFDPAGVLDLTA